MFPFDATLKISCGALVYQISANFTVTAVQHAEPGIPDSRRATLLSFVCTLKDCFATSCTRDFTGLTALFKCYLQRLPAGVLTTAHNRCRSCTTAEAS